MADFDVDEPGLAEPPCEVASRHAQYTDLGARVANSLVEVVRGYPMGFGKGGDPSGAQRPVALGEDLFRVLEVVHDRNPEDAVDAGISKWKPGDVGGREPVAVTVAASAFLEKSRRQIKTEIMPRAHRVEVTGTDAGATPEFEE